MRLGVLVLYPSRLCADGDKVKNNGEEQKQGNDPPASRVGDPTAKHDRRSASGVHGEERRAKEPKSVRSMSYASLRSDSG